MAQKKITFIELSKIANYYKTTESEWQGKKGIFYFLTENLTEAQRKELSGYNCEILISRSQFAPELKKTVIFTPKKLKKRKIIKI